MRAGLEVPVLIRLAISRLGAELSVDLGTPVHTAYCAECQRNVGGPYFDKREALARVKEHRYGLHEVNRSTWVPTPREVAAAKRRRMRGSFVE